MVEMDNLAQDLLKQVGSGKMNSLAYDTAWLARMGEIDQELSYRALSWISENQLPDGSWGTKFPVYYHDRVISTLGAMIALTYRGRRGQDRKQIELGLQALERIVAGATQGLLSDPNGATVGFEMIAPTLVAEAENLGIIKKQGERILGRLSRQRKAKLALIKDKKINRQITAAFSAEMAGLDGQSMLDSENLQEQNGSVGHSPSATAYYALYVKPQDESALKYLHGIATNGGAPDLYPFDVFETTWVLWNLSLCQGWNSETRQLFQPLIRFLKTNWKPQIGIGLSVGYSVPDGDDTAFVYEVLSKLDKAPDLEALLSFEKEEHFRTYHYEANSSASVNIHMLSALRMAGFPYDHPAIQKILVYLHKVKFSDKYWFDKWHLSPYYTTSHAVIACAGFADFLVKNSVEWILSTQNADGSWGQQTASAEETAYALQALCIWRQKGSKVKVPMAAIHNGAKWLQKHSQTPNFPLWIGKGLYCPEIVVNSAILSALQLSLET
jgi:halimadienyl-diphosphate synthase